jgi:hypothetical protein
MHKLSLLVSSVLLTICLSAQVTHFSPYSRFGVGDVYESEFSLNRSLAGAGIAFMNTNTYNATSLTAATALTSPLFEVNFSSNQLTHTNQTESQTNSIATFSGFAFASSLGEKGGFSFGLKPYSRIGYAIFDNTMMDSVETKTSLDADGGLNNAFLNIAKNLVDKEGMSLAVGVRGNFLFGNLSTLRSIEFPNNEDFFKAESNITTSARNFQMEAGASFSKTLNTKWKGTVAANYTFATNLNANQEKLDRTYAVSSSTGEKVYKDTIAYALLNDKTITLPSGIHAGISATYNEKLTLVFDYSNQNWSSYAHTLGASTTSQEMVNSSKLAFGVFYQPEGSRLFNAKLWKSIQYKAGVNLNKHNIALNGDQVKGFGTVFGLSIPINRRSTITRLNFTYENSVRGEVSSNLIEEKSSRFVIGITISPSFNDKWFYKRKYE